MSGGVECKRKGLLYRCYQSKWNPYMRVVIFQYARKRKLKVVVFARNHEMKPYRFAR